MYLKSDDRLAAEITQAIRKGDTEALRHLLAGHPDVGRARIVTDGRAGKREARTLLHIATDWPGHFPRGAETVAILLSFGADVNAPFEGSHRETPLHWAASSDDVAVLDALLDGGADIEAPGAVIGGLTPLADAVAFGQWRAAKRLLERGAEPNLWQAAALGLLEPVKSFFAHQPGPECAEVTNAFWCACHGGQPGTAAYLLERGADRNWVGHDGLTPLDAANRSGATELADWLRREGGKSAQELRSVS